MFDRLRSAVRRLLRRGDKQPRRPRLLSGGPAPDPRLPGRSLDPNASFLGEQMN